MTWGGKEWKEIMKALLFVVIVVFIVFFLPNILANPETKIIKQTFYFNDTGNATENDMLCSWFCLPQIVNDELYNCRYEPVLCSKGTCICKRIIEPSPKIYADG